MDLWRIAVRAIVAYVYLLVMTRASGKRAVSQSTPFDFVVSVLLGDLIDDAIWAEVSIAKFGTAAGSIILCEILTKLGAFHSPAFFKLVNGVPSQVLRDGREDHDELRREQLSEADLTHLLRSQGIGDNRGDVRLALVERDHQLSIVRRPAAEPARKKEAEKVKEMLQQ